MFDLNKLRNRTSRTSTSEHGMFVRSQTIGCRTFYAMRSENISRSGLLLTWDSKYRSPFREKTILELRIDCEGNLFDQPVECLAKVVRIEDGIGHLRKYGVQIVQIAGVHQHAWESKICELEDINLASESLEHLQSA